MFLCSLVPCIGYTEPNGWVAIRAQAADVNERKAAGVGGETDNILDMLATMESPPVANTGPAEPGQRRPINTNESRKHAPLTKGETQPEPEPEPEPDSDDGEEKPTSCSREETMLARVAALSVQQLLNQKVGFIQDRLVRHCPIRRCKLTLLHCTQDAHLARCSALSESPRR